MKPRRVGVVTARARGERNGSEDSGRAVCQALIDGGHEVVPIPLDGGDPATALSDAGIDVAFLALQGRFAEDGCVQAILEWLRIPYTGSSVLGSALAGDKLKAKELFRLHNVPTPPYYALEGPVSAEEVLEVHGSFGFPAMVKPRRQGSSLCVARAETPGELTQAVEAAFGCDDGVLVERFIEGQGIQVAVLDGRALGAIEIEGGRAQNRLHLPPRLGVARKRGVEHLAEQAARSVSTTGLVLVDLIVTQGQNEYVLGLSTLFEMTPTAALSRIAQAAGLDFVDLCEAMLERARLHVSVPAPPGAEVLSFPDPGLASELGSEASELAVARAHSGRARQRSRTR